jgi:hypothetical protein
VLQYSFFNPTCNEIHFLWAPKVFSRVALALGGKGVLFADHVLQFILSAEISIKNGKITFKRIADIFKFLLLKSEPHRK